jgi:integrase
MVLIIEHAKTPSGERRLEVPDDLAPLLRRLVAGRQPDEVRFASPASDDGKRCSRWLWEWTGRVCDRAGVPRRCPHGMLGTHATLAASAPGVNHVVAAALGHSGTAVTKRHYLDAGVVESGGVRRALRVLAGGTSEQEAPEPEGSGG